MYTLVFVADIVSLSMLLLFVVQIFEHSVSSEAAEININFDFSITCFLLLWLPPLPTIIAHEFSVKLGVRTSF
jgi:bacteriorhodopsin